MSSLVTIERVSIQGLKGKTIYEFEPEDFEKIFARGAVTMVVVVG